MRVSTRGEYGLLALVELAVQAGSGPVTGAQIAERQGIPRQYLDQLMLSLKSARLVVSERGRMGGYRLAREAASITLHDAIAALEARPERECFADMNTRRKNAARGVLRRVWQQMDAQTEEMLRARTLADVAQESAAAESLVTYEI